MNHFGSTFILCFLGFLFIQANAIASWKTCSVHSDCQATGEYCELWTVNSEPGKCVYCAELGDNDMSDSIDGSMPTWCSDYLKFNPAASTTLTSSSVLTYVKQAGWLNDVSLCPSFDACTKNCRKEYSVEKTTTQVTLTSTFTDTSDCVCDKLSFTYTLDEDDYEWVSTSNSFDAGVTSSSIWQHAMNTLDLWTEKVTSAGGYEIDCVWEYSIGTSSSPAATLTCLLGLISAIVVAFALL